MQVRYFKEAKIYTYIDYGKCVSSLPLIDQILNIAYTDTKNIMYKTFQKLIIIFSFTFKISHFSLSFRN